MSEKELIATFEFIGQHLTKAVIEKCLEICSKYNISAEDLADHWSAFSMTYLKDAPISVDGVSSMEQRMFSSKQNTNSVQDKSDIVKTQFPDNSKKSDTSEIMECTQTSIYEVGDTAQNDSIIEESVCNDEPDIKYADYKDRSGAGTVVASFGNANSYVTISSQISNVTIYRNSEWYTEQNFTGLYTTQARIANSFDNKIISLGQTILQRKGIETINSDENTVVYGRIKSIDGGKVSVRTIMLETYREFKGPKEILLNIDNINSYSLFSGQIVAVQGTIIPKKFLVQEICYDGSPEFSSEILDLNENSRIMVAAGPFTLFDNLSYDPLYDLLKQVVEQKPNVLILIGPFLDSTHPEILTLEKTYEEHFELVIKTIMDYLVKWPVQVVIVSSFNDAHHFPCYPTPSYIIRDYPNLMCAPNPCLLNVDGLIIGISSLDILFQLTKEEISRNIRTDRISRLAAHILSQRSFYPIYPNRDHSVPIDYERLLNDCTIEVKPHLLILPSTLRYFIRNVEGCLVVNPERLVKKHVGGTYAIINFNPSLKAGCIIDCITCEIKNI